MTCSGAQPAGAGGRSHPESQPYVHTWLRGSCLQPQSSPELMLTLHMWIKEVNGGTQPVFRVPEAALR